MNNQNITGQVSLDHFVNKLGLFNQILCDQLQLVIDENQDGGDLISNGISDVLEDDRLPRELHEKLLPMFVRMQNKDIMHQQLVGVKTALRLALRQLKVSSLGSEKGQQVLPDMDKLLEQIYDSYVMQTQRVVHRKALGEELEEQVDEGGLDFF